MTHETPSPSSSGHRPRGDAVWSAARADYLAGGSASEVCERHGISLSTFRWRARNEGWRRADQQETAYDEPFVDPNTYENGWTPPPYDPFGLLTGDQTLDRVSPVAPYPTRDDGPDDEDDEPGSDIYETPLQLAEMAWAHAARAVRRGRMIEARGWTRLYRDLTAASLLTTEAADRVNAKTDKAITQARSMLDELKAVYAAGDAYVAPD